MKWYTFVGMQIAYGLSTQLRYRVAQGCLNNPASKLGINYRWKLDQLSSPDLFSNSVIQPMELTALMSLNYFTTPWGRFR